MNILTTPLAITCSYHKVYAQLGSTVIKNINAAYTVCKNSKGTLWDRSITLNFDHFLYITTMSFDIRATATTTMTAGFCMCASSLNACVDLKPYVSLRLTGGGYANFFVSYIVLFISMKIINYKYICRLCVKELKLTVTFNTIWNRMHAFRHQLDHRVPLHPSKLV